MSSPLSPWRSGFSATSVKWSNYSLNQPINLVPWALTRRRKTTGGEVLMSRSSSRWREHPRSRNREWRWCRKRCRSRPSLSHRESTYSCNQILSGHVLQLSSWPWTSSRTKGVKRPYLSANRWSMRCSRENFSKYRPPWTFRTSWSFFRKTFITMKACSTLQTFWGCRESSQRPLTFWSGACLRLSMHWSVISSQWHPKISTRVMACILCHRFNYTQGQELTL